jgi:hypothetical protein
MLYNIFSTHLKYKGGLSMKNDYGVAIRKSIKWLIDEKFNGVILQFAGHCGVSDRIVLNVVNGTTKNAPRGDLLGFVFDAFPGIRPEFIFRYEFPAFGYAPGAQLALPEANFREQAIEAYVASPAERIAELERELLIARGNADYMRKLYEDCVKK